jgi:hypothetical protein
MSPADPQPESRIFISYRREDSSGHVLALLPALRTHFGANRIFKDTDNIPPGVDFVKFIRSELESCSVLLAVIGRDWLTIEDPRLKARRLDNPDDFLRVEVSTALKNERIRVIPVLVDKGTMPTAEDLPPDLTELSFRNALELSDARWESDVKRLVEAIQRACAPAAEKVESPPERPELRDLQKRRAREIASHLQEARDAFERKDYEATLWACEKALLLDPQGTEALELLDRARKSIDEQKIEGWLAEARRLLQLGDLGGASELIDEALSLNHASEPALALRLELLQLRRERERERERARITRAAIERARTSLDEEDFDAAINHADDVLAVDPQSAEAQEIRSKAQAALDERRRQREHKRRAQQAVTDAKAAFADGKHDVALRLLRDFSPAHDLVSKAILELQEEFDAIEQRRRREEELKRETETRARQETARLAEEAETKRRAEEARARQEAARLAEEAAAKRRAEEAKGREEAARLAAQAEAKRRAEALRAAVAAARESLDRGQLESVVRHADAALAIDSTNADAQALRDRARAGLAERRAREEHDRRARQAVESAESLVRKKDHGAAVDLLERFHPPHALVAEALDKLRVEIREIHEREERERRAREAAEQARLEAARAAEERRQAEARERERTAALALQQKKEREERERQAREAADQARREAARAAEERRLAEAREHDRQEAERQQKACEERIQKLLTDAQSAFAAKSFRAAKRRASEVVALAPGNATALALVDSATQELRALRRALWTPPRLAAAGAAVAVAVLLVALWNRPDAPTTSAPAPQPLEKPGPRSVEPSPPIVPPPEPADAHLKRVQPYRDRARQFLRNRQYSQALSAAVEGLRIEPSDPALQSVLDTLLNNAQRTSQRAKKAAMDAGAPARAEKTFADGRKLEEEATRLQAANKKEPAIRTFVRAGERFDLAAREAADHANAEARQKLADEARQKQIAEEQARQKSTVETPPRPAPPAPEPRATEEPKIAEKRPAPPPEKPPASEPASRAAEEERIRATLRRYEAAYDSLNAAAVRAVYPSVQRDLERLFRQFESYDLTFADQKIQLSPDGMSATASCQVIHDFKPSGAARQRQTRTQTFSLRKQGDSWIIVDPAR